jgi:maltose alpha-D-glucosyltransferase/alpha-amylase
MPWPDDWLASRLRSFLPHQRWFGGKARTITQVALLDHLPLVGASAAWVLVSVSFGDAPPERYGLLVRALDHPAALPAIGERPGSAGPLWIVEAGADAASERALLEGFSRTSAAVTARGGRLRYGDVSEAGRAAGSDPRVALTPLRDEQSNTSLRIGSSLVFKLFRRLAPGENPELEVGRFLTARTSFRSIAALDGSIVYESPEGDASTVAVLQRWIENDGDGWTRMLSWLRRCLEARRTPRSLEHDVRLLGRTTAELQAALACDPADPAFAPEPVTRADVDAWRSAAQAQAERTRALLERHVTGWPPDTRAAGESLLRLWDRLGARLGAAVADPVSDWQKARVHGDYHLGQTLKTPNGFAIIDFEGEPARPLAERRQKHCVLKDVAGMLRSFDYAVEVAADGVPDAAGRLRAWAPLREWFLAGYGDTMARERPALLPSTERERLRWLGHFEVEKALYELDYEINNRPAWAHVPLRGMLRLLTEGP